MDAVNYRGCVNAESSLAAGWGLKESPALVESKGVRSQPGQACDFTDTVALGRCHHPQYALWTALQSQAEILGYLSMGRGTMMLIGY